MKNKIIVQVKSKDFKKFIEKKQIMDKKNTTVIVCMAIGAITILEVYALSQGINGVLLTGVIAIVAGLAGWMAPQPKI